MDHDSAPLHSPPLNSFVARLRDGYAEQRFRESIQDIITECGGNRLFARGIAIDIVKEETERRK